MAKRTSSTDPHLRAVLDARPATAGDLHDHEKAEESTLKTILRSRVAILGACALIGGPAVTLVGGLSWAGDKVDAKVSVKVAPVLDAVHDLQADASALELRVRVLEQGQAELKAEARGTREDLRLLFPRLPALPPPDGGP